MKGGNFFLNPEKFEDKMYVDYNTLTTRFDPNYCLDMLKVVELLRQLPYVGSPKGLYKR